MVHNGHNLVEEEVHNGHSSGPLHIVLCCIGKMECPLRHDIPLVYGEADYDGWVEDGHEEALEMQSTCHGHVDQRQESLDPGMVEAVEVEELL